MAPSSPTCPYIPYLFILLIILCPSCARSGHNPASQMPAPDRVIELDKVLDEISGLAYHSEGLLAAIQDEKGNIYLISMTDGEIMNKIDFGKDGDYEGIAIYDNFYFIVESGGKMWISVMDSLKESHRADLETKGGTEIEGICYDPERETFLVAYKTTHSGFLTNERSIFTYQPGISGHSEAPAFTLNNKLLAKYMRKQPKDDNYSVLLRSMKISLPHIPLFKPSGITINPENGHAFVISSLNRLLLEYDLSRNKIIGLYQLDKKILPQPEGITFTADGDLVIASEKGSKKKARIAVFEEWSLNPQDVR